MNAASFALPRPRPAKASSADDWFFALDQQQVGSGGDSWVAQVLGIHREREGLWVQVAPADNPSATIVLRVSISTQLDEVLSALQRACRNGHSHPQVIDLTNPTEPPRH